MSEGLRQAQDLWQSSMEQWVDLAQKALPQSGITGESLKTLFDPSQWAQAGLGPLDAAIEHLVEGPSYATLWTLDRKILKAQKLRARVGKGPRCVSGPHARRMERGRQAVPQGNQ